MIARLDPLAWIWPGSLLLGAAAAMGVLAGVDPELALLATIGLVFTALVVADLTAGVALFVLLSFLDVLPGVAGPSIGLTKLLGVVLFLSWLAYTATASGGARRDFLADRPSLSYLLVLFLAWVAASAVWAESAGEAGDTLQRLALNVALFPVVYTAVRTRKQVAWVLIAFVAGAIASAVYGSVSPSVEAGVRLTGARFEPNELAAVLVAGVALSAGLASAARGVGARSAAITAAAICAAGVMVTLSRAGLVALGLMLVAGLVIASRRRGAALIVALLVVLGTAGYFAFLAPPGARERVTTVERGTGRLDLWQVGWRMFEAEPVRGVGAGNFEISSVHYLLEPGEVERSDFIVDKPKVAHNTYLQFLAELGIVGLLLFLSVVALALGSALRAARRFEQGGDSGAAALARGAALAVVGILAADFFASGQFSNQLWFLLALGPALLSVASRETAP